jgi:flavodoxin
MRAAVVYESYFGHTRGVAAAIAEGLRARADVDAVDIYEVGDAPADLDVDLLVVGGPVHAWSMSRE